MKSLVAGLLSVLAVAGVAAQFKADPPIRCSSCDGWNAPREPFRVFGNTYYVGVAGLSTVLVTSDAGHVLLDAGLPQSAPAIDAHIRALGFRTQDVKLIVNSHAHFDHGGGIAAMQRASGAEVAASPSGARALEAGEPTPDDPQYAFGRAVNGFPRVSHVRVVKDGEVLRVGPIALTAHLTPGHTPGSTTWTWKSCEGTRCLDVVYADSLNSVSAPGFRFNGDASHPRLVDAFRKSIATVADLPCDVLLSVHPEFSGMDRKLQARAAGGAANPFIDAQACRVYAASALRSLDRRVAEER
ncbi:MAG: subclass B3 metallo-beta-lactamase [Acidobacteriota bacterium]